MQVTISGILYEVDIFDRVKVIGMLSGIGKKSPSWHRLEAGLKQFVKNGREFVLKLVSFIDF
jgi:hypothetical protein